MSKILIVEDEGIVAQGIRNKLENLGHSVPAVVSFGEEVITHVEDTQPDLILMDIKLEGKMDGIHAAKQLRKSHDIPIVYLTAYADDDTLKRAKLTEPAGYLLKPYEERDLSTIIEIALYKHSMESKLRKSERWLSTTLKSIGDAVLAADIKGNVVYVNPAAEALTGWKHNDIIGKSLEDILVIENLDDNETIQEIADRVLREEVTNRFTEKTFLINRSGEKVPIADCCAPINDDEGNIVGTVFILQDITRQEDVEREMQDLLERYQSLCNNLTIGLYRTTQDGKIILANPAMVKMLGYDTFEDLSERNLEDDLYELGYERKKYEEMLEENGEIRDFETTLKRKDGEIIYVRENAKAIKDRNGKVLYYEGTLEDITENVRLKLEREKIDAKIKQIEKLESLSVLAGGIAHDFNNSLQAILGNTGLAMMNMSSVSPEYERLKQVEKSTFRAAELTKQMLAYSGKGMFVVSAIDLSQLITEISQFLKDTVSNNIDLKLNLQSNLPFMEGDSSQIRQVITQLVENASEAIEEKSGVITVSTGVMECNSKYLSSTYLDDDLKDGTYTYVEITDNGCGMNTEILSRVFDPFYSTKFVGRSLGLAAVLGIIRGHNGAVGVSSEPDIGTTFKVLFPVKVFSAIEKKEETQNDDIWHGSGTVLVVDDEVAIRNLVRLVLEKAGYTVLTASNGREGVDVFRKHSDDIRLVLMDFTMPKMNGEEASIEIVKIRKDIPVILSSGYGEDMATDCFGGEGLSGFIQKPYSPSILLNKIRSVLNKQG
ncbi:MAG: response regulator [Candidatus Hatepunaea meridiana]|nr:response regulator [Candidatus Hatepunaea meridiana]